MLSPSISVSGFTDTALHTTEGPKDANFGLLWLSPRPVGAHFEVPTKQCLRLRDVVGVLQSGEVNGFSVREDDDDAIENGFDFVLLGLNREIYELQI